MHSSSSTGVTTILKEFDMRSLKHNQRGSSNGGAVGGVFVLLAILGLIVYGIWWETGPKQGLHEATITVCSVEDSKNGSGHEYRIYASDDTYKMADSWTGVERRDTADAYGLMKREVAKGPVTFDVTLKGERRHTPTNFANILVFKRAAVQTPKECDAPS